MNGGNQVRLSILMLLAAAKEQGVSITRTSVAKLLYFADLKSIEQSGEARSGVHWKWMHYGPYSMVIRDAEKALSSAGEIEVDKSMRNAVQYGEIILRGKESPQGEIDVAFFEIIRGVVAHYGHFGATALSTEAYQTYPMVRAQQLARRGCNLDLHDKSFPIPNTSTIKGRVAAALEDHVDESEAGDYKQGMTDLLTETETLRHRAFAKAL